MTADVALIRVEPLTANERRDLLRLARASIRCALDAAAARPQIALTAPLIEPAAVFTPRSLPSPLAFDHARILADYFTYKSTGRRPPYDR